MFIAHVPTAYLMTCLSRRLDRYRLWVLVGAVLPDADMIAFHALASTTHHHSFLTHRPAVWLLLLGIALLACLRWRVAGVVALSIGALSHLALDSVTGRIAWGWPVWQIAQPRVEVPATQDWWVLSFVLHWTFLVELALCGLALILRWRRVQKICTLHARP